MNTIESSEDTLEYAMNSKTYRAVYLSLIYEAIDNNYRSEALQNDVKELKSTKVGKN